MTLSTKQLWVVAVAIALYFTIKDYLVNRQYYRSLLTGELTTDFTSVFTSLLIGLLLNLAVTAIVMVVTYMFIGEVAGSKQAKSKRRR
jgi:hypothetical protein